MKIFQRTFFLFVLVSFLILLFSGFCLAQRKLEIIYPTVPGVEAPTTIKTALPEYLKYLFTFAITIAGILAFGALIYGGFSYLTSAGDPSKMKEGQDQVMAGFLGLIIILSSYLILNTINPQLVILKKPAVEEGMEGVRIYTLTNCQENEENPSFSVRLSIDDLTSPKLDWGFDGNQIKSIKFLGAPDTLDVTLYENEDFNQKVQGDSETIKYPSGDTEPCKPVILTACKSISLDWRIPGVYLYANEDCAGDKYGEDYVTFQASSATLPEFDDKTKAIKFIYDDEDPHGSGNFNIRYAAILHEDENFMGKATFFDQDHNVCKKLTEKPYLTPVDLTNEVSSVTIYLKPIGTPIGQGVRFWGDKNYTMEKDQFVLPDQNPLIEEKYYGKDYEEDSKKWDNGYYVSNVEDEDEKEGTDNKISSMEIKGHYLALLFENTDYNGECEVFMSSDPDFRSNRIGQCGFLGRTDCLSSFIIKARK